MTKKTINQKILKAGSPEFKPAGVEFFNAHEIGICIKDRSAKVLDQNKICSKVCGKWKGKVCKKGCMESTMSGGEIREFYQGFQNRKRNQMKGHLLESTLLFLEDRIITFFIPIKNKVMKQINVLQKYQLTKREIEILKLILMGLSNTEIAAKLFISKTTLKTHINNLNKKLPAPEIEKIRAIRY